MRMPRTILPLVLCMAAAIAAPFSQSAAAAAPESGAPIGRWLQPSTAPISPEARIFLVAGARDIANFAQEVVDQKQLWLARGYAPAQIECFFAAPPPDQREDVAQFLALEQPLRDCHLASPADVFNAMVQVATGYTHDHFYLYISSHGSRPTGELPEGYVRRIDPQSAWLPQAMADARADRNSSAYAWLSPFHIAMEGIRFDAQRWGWVSHFARLRQSRLDPGLPLREHLFTPKLLAAALQTFPAEVRKVVVIQACYSGGFVLPPEQAPAPEESLLNVKNITVLTAARADRTSFGCDQSGETTYYGRSVQKVLDANPGLTVEQLDWRQVHEQVSGEVEELEQQTGIGERARSVPQFHADEAGDPAPDRRNTERRRPRSGPRSR
jgi:hypothetical protein